MEEQREEWRTERSEECLIDNCVKPVDLRDGQYCTDHSPKVRKMLSPPPKPSQVVMPESDNRPLTRVPRKTRGPKTISEFQDFLADMMAGLVDGSIEPEAGIVAVKAAETLLKAAITELSVSGSSRMLGDGKKDD